MPTIVLLEGAIWTLVTSLDGLILMLDNLVTTYIHVLSAQHHVDQTTPQMQLSCRIRQAMCNSVGTSVCFFLPFTSLLF